MFVCPICHALINSRTAHLDWHAARSTAQIRRHRRVLDAITTDQTVQVTVEWSTPMPDDTYDLALAVDAEVLGLMDLTIATQTDTGCVVELTPHYDLTAAVLDLTAHYPAPETGDTHG